MAQRPINVVIKGDYTDKDIKRAIRDLHTLEKQGPKSAKSVGLLSTQFKGLALSFGAGAALGLVGRQLTSMAKTAIEDQQSVVALSKAMENLGLASQNAGVEDFIRQQMLATGVMDDELRPAMARILRSTEDVAEAQKALGIALDIHAAIPAKSLDVIMNALGKAYDGNAASLGRLGLGLDKATLKGGDMVKITSILQKKFGGQAAAAAETYGGKIARVSAAADEASESIGYALLNSLDKVSESFGGTDGAVGSIAAFGEATANVVTGIGESVAAIAELVTIMQSGEKETTDWGDTLRNFGVAMGVVFPPLAGLTLAVEGFGDVGERAAVKQQAFDDSLRASELLYAGYITTLDTATGKERDRRDALEKSKSSVDRLKDSLDKLYGGNRTIIGQRIDLREGFAEGPGKKATRDDAKQWALSQAQTASSLAGDLFAQGKKGQALKTYQNARQDLMASLSGFGIGKGFVNNILGPAPKWLRGDVERQQSAAGAKEWQRNASKVYQTVNIYVKDAPQAAATAHNAARLAALERGMGNGIDWEQVARRAAGQ